MGGPSQVSLLDRCLKSAAKVKSVETMLRDSKLALAKDIARAYDGGVSQSELARQLGTSGHRIKERRVKGTQALEGGK